MSHTSVIGASGLVALTCVLLAGPGWLVLRRLGVRGLAAAALAPALSSAVLAVGAVLAERVGVRWGLPAAAACAALAWGAAALGRGRRPGAPPAPAAASAAAGRVWPLVASVVTGTLLAVVPLAVGMSSLDAVPQRWDAVFHLSALRLVEESGSASSLTLGGLSYGSGRDAFYPAGWHAVAALLPSGSPVATLNVVGLVGTAAVWVLGCAALARALLPGLPGAPGTAAVAAGLVTAAPVSLWVGWGHAPNAAALAMAPGVLAYAIDLLVRPGDVDAGPARFRGPVLLVGALLGVGLTHPNAAIAVGALLVPLLAWSVAARAAALRAAGRRVHAVVLPLAVGVAAAVAVLGLLRSPVAGVVTGYVGSAPDPVAVAVREVLIGRYALWAHVSTTCLVVLAPLGAVLAWRRRRPWVVGMLVVAWLLYVDAATGGPTGVSSLWYTSAARLSVVVTMVAIPLSAGALAAGWSWAWPRLARPAARAGAVAAVGAAVVVLAWSGGVFRSVLTSQVYDAAREDHPRFVTTEELAMIERLGARLDPEGAVLGSPFSGASLVHGLTGHPVVFPVAGQVWSPAQAAVMDGLGSLGSDPAVCAALTELAVRYLYQDEVPYQEDEVYRPLDLLEVPGARVVDTGGTARVLELPPCDE